MALALQHDPVQTSASPDPIIYDAADMRRLLRCSAATMHRRLAAGQMIRPLKWGGKLVWRVAEVKLWVEAGMPTADEWEARKKAR